MSEPRARSRGESWRSNVFTIGAALVLALFIRIVLFELFAIDGPSMEPTLYDGDRVVVAKYPFGLFLPFTDRAVLNWGGPEPGDVVIVHSPADNEDIVKRVIGVGGDEIGFREGKVMRNGEPIASIDLGECDKDAQKSFDPWCHVYKETIAEHPYRVSHSKHDFPRDDVALKVPEGHVYVLGDHRDRSNDSRNPLIGAVTQSRLKGKALVISMSWKNGKGPFWKRIRWDRVGTSVQ